MQMTKEKFLNDSEIKTLLSNCENSKNKRDSILFRLILFTGCRTGEVILIRKKDLDQGCVSITAIKHSNNRTIPVPSSFFSELLDYSKDMSSDDILFPMTTRNIRLIWEKYRPNNSKGCHSMRHSFGVKFYQNSRDFHAVRTALGHVSYQSSMVYLSYVESTEKIKSTTDSMWNSL